MSLFEKIATRVALRFSDRIASEIFYHSLNENLVQMAEERSIELPGGVDLVGYALRAAQEAGAGDDTDMIAMDAINQIVFREKTESEKEYSKVYVQTTILPTKVLEFKADGWTLEDIRNDEFFKNMCNKYDINPNLITKYYDGHTKPNKVLKNVGDLGKKKTAPRDSIFDAFVKNHGRNFVSYWMEAIKHKAHDIVRHNYSTNRALEDALSIVGDHDEHYGELGTVQESHVKKEEKELTTYEAKSMKKELLSLAKKKNPHYEAALKLIMDGYEITSNSDIPMFEKELHMDRHQFMDFRQYFLKDLSTLLKEVGVHGVNDGLSVFTASKVAFRIALKLAKR